MIDKTPRAASRFAIDRRYADSARAGFATFLESVADRAGRVLLPAYIGQSPIEGSGVFDPIAAAELPYGFYRVDRELRVDLDDLERQLDESPVLAVFVIHYFGRPEPGLFEIAAMARRRGALLVEDCAHSIGSRTEDGTPLGATGDVALFSIHKVLGVDTGGYLQVNNPGLDIAEVAPRRSIDPAVRAEIERANWAEIHRRRVDNYRRLAPAVAELDGVELFWSELGARTIPQNLPVRITGTDRFEVYKRMRADGVGVVALYHTLIEAIATGAFPDSHALSATILNLPIHQEIEVADLPRIAASLRSAVLD